MGISMTRGLVVCRIRGQLGGASGVRTGHGLAGEVCKNVGSAYAGSDQVFAASAGSAKAPHSRLRCPGVRSADTCARLIHGMLSFRLG